MVNVEKEIRIAVDTGEVIMGERRTLRTAKAKEVKMVIRASNCRQKAGTELKKCAGITELPLYEFNGSSVELGAICGRPYLVSMLGIVNPGDSDVLKLGRG